MLRRPSRRGASRVVFHDVSQESQLGIFPTAKVYSIVRDGRWLNGGVSRLTRVRAFLNAARQALQRGYPLWIPIPTGSDRQRGRQIGILNRCSSMPRCQQLPSAHLWSFSHPRTWLQLGTLRDVIFLKSGQRENGLSMGVASDWSGVRAVFNTIAISV